MLPVSPEELVALSEAIIEQHIDALKRQLGVIYLLGFLFNLLLRGVWACHPLGLLLYRPKKLVLL